MISLINRFKSKLYYLGGGGGLLGVPVIAGLSLGKGGGVWVIILVTFVTLLILLLIFWVCVRSWKKKKGNELSEMLRKDGGSVEVSGIESMRSNFETGVEKLQKANKNVYDLPWFLLAGQAGSGKTEAIRRSHAKEDFPPGLNDLMQGVGGTLNMNWWFTNKGIILDTAGRVFEEKVKAGKTNEWQEFLKILKKARKNMPINGFILTISADSLIRDDFSAIEEKASHIAEQITLVQNVLGVRFPVFILVTKADFISGFREFVENISEPNLQQQMLGWSNPASLDEPFAPEQVDEYLDDVISKLKKRRLTYLLDPRPQADKRLDDLDASFTFPNELRAAIPNLRRYIEIVFSLNPWSQKPLFIRGIYFTSSLQQGDALDKAIAEVMGKKLGDMALSSFKKETPLFLRDVFFEKIYREPGLVTSSGEVKSAMRRRTMIFTFACLLGISAILAAAFFGSRAFRKSIGDEYAHWEFAQSGYHDSVLEGQVEWSRPIVYDTGIDDTFESEKDVNFEVSGQTYTLPTYLEQMATYTQAELEVPVVFRPFKFFDDVFTGDSLDRESALRSLYEDAVVLPILVNGREKLRAVTEDSWVDSNAAAGLHSLIQIQILLNQMDRPAGYSAKLWNELDELYYFLTGDHLGSELEKVYVDLYTDEYCDLSGWPNATFSHNYAAIDNLNDAGLAAISHGLDLWTNEIGNIRLKQEDDMQRLVGLLTVLEGVGQVEQGLLSTAIANRLIDIEEVNNLANEYAKFEESTKDLAADQEHFTFTSYYEEQINRAKEDVDTRVNDLNTGVNTASDGSGKLSQEILARVDQQRKELVESFDRIADPELLKQFENADQDYLNAQNGVEVRLSFYNEFASYLQQLENITLEEWSMGVPVLLDLRREHEALVAPFRGRDHSTEDQSNAEDQLGVGKVKALAGEKAVSSDSEQGKPKIGKLKALAEKKVAAPVDSEDNESTRRQSKVDELNILADEGLVEAKIRVFEEYQRLLLEELKRLVGFPVLADSPHIISLNDISKLDSKLEKVADEITKFRAEMGEVQSEEFELMFESLEKISLFVESNLTAELIEETATFEFPKLSELSSSGSLNDTINWRARLVELKDFGKPVRIANQVKGLGEMRLNDREMNLLFTSTLDTEPGDVARINISGGWAPLQFLLRPQQGSIKSLGDGKYIFRGQIGIPNYKALEYSVLLHFPPSTPRVDKWLRISDLKGF